MKSGPAPLLIVEDNPVYAEILERLLPTLGADLRFTSKWVDNAEQAIEEIKQQQFELVLLDYKLPGADGMTVLAHIRSLPASKQPAVIMLTGMGNEAVAVEAMKRGAKDYLPKDSLDVPSLVRAITSALERKRLEEQVASYTVELREKNAQMEADLNMAREIQQAFLPQQYPTFPRGAGAKESALRFYHRYHPTGAVGGDYFDVLPLSDTQAGVFICDVMGHGVRAALVTAMVRTFAEQFTAAGADAGKFLTDLNQGLLRVLKQTRMPMFTSAFYMVVDLARGSVEYANAGHPIPLFLNHAAGMAQPLSFEGGTSGPALGIFDESVYSSCTCAIAPRDLILLFTDGLYEVEGANDEQYGQDRLLAAVRQRVGAPPAKLFEELMAEVSQFSAGRGFVDDVCLLGVEVARAGVLPEAEEAA